MFASAAERVLPVYSASSSAAWANSSPAGCVHKAPRVPYTRRTTRFWAPMRATKNAGLLGLVSVHRRTLALPSRASAAQAGGGAAMVSTLSWSRIVVSAVLVCACSRVHARAQSDVVGGLALPVRHNTQKAEAAAEPGRPALWQEAAQSRAAGPGLADIGCFESSSGGWNFGVGPVGAGHHSGLACEMHQLGCSQVAASINAMGIRGVDKVECAVQSTLPLLCHNALVLATGTDSACTAAASGLNQMGFPGVAGLSCQTLLGRFNLHTDTNASCATVATGQCRRQQHRAQPGRAAAHRGPSAHLPAASSARAPSGAAGQSTQH